MLIETMVKLTCALPLQFERHHEGSSQDRLFLFHLLTELVTLCE